MDIPLKHELLNEVLAYLGKQQYQDVYVLIAKIQDAAAQHFASAAAPTAVGSETAQNTQTF
jgi:hypothetical protein